MDQLNESARLISWTDQLDGPGGRTTSLYMKPWALASSHVRRLTFQFVHCLIASESFEGLVINDMSNVKAYLDSTQNTKMYQQQKFALFPTKKILYT